MPTSDRARRDAIDVVRALRDAGHVAYFAGGCVRDELLGLAPADHDVATDAPPGRVREVFPGARLVGEAFGVALVRRGRTSVEVATFRAEGAYSDGRRPDAVRFTTAEEDARRRDFTINGLFLDPLDDAGDGGDGGRVIDFVGGRADLAAGVLRAIGDADARFAEDHLRLLRAVRFAARFGLTVDPATDAAIGRHAGKLARITPERIADELRKMLPPVTRLAAVAMLRRHGLLDVTLGALPTGHGADAGSGIPNLKFETSDRPANRLFPALAPGDAIPFALALSALALARAAGPDLAEADVLAAVGPPTVRKIVRGLRDALRISNDEASAVEGTLSNLAVLLAPADTPTGEPTEARLKRLLATPTARDARLLFHAVKPILDFTGRLSSIADRLFEYERTDFAPPPLLTGDDLIAAGMRPGPGFKRVLDDAYDAQLEGRVTTKSEALAAVSAGSVSAG